MLVNDEIVHGIPSLPKNRAVQTLAIAAELEQAVYDRGLDKGLDFNDPNVSGWPRPIRR